MSAKPGPVSLADPPKHRESNCQGGMLWVLELNGLNCFGCSIPAPSQLYSASAIGFVSQHQPNVCYIDFVFERSFPTFDSQMA